MRIRFPGSNIYQKILASVVALCLLALATTAIFVFTYTPDKPERNIYRDDKLDTYLGGLPQPVKIFQNQQHEFVAITEEGKRIPLNKIPAINGNKYGDIYFDKYDDRIFYHQGHQLKVYDIQKESTRSLPYRGGSIKDHEISGVYKGRLLTQLEGGQIGAAKFASYDLENNQSADTDYDADRISSALTVATAFTINGTRYHLYADTRKKHEHAVTDTLSIYLDQKGAAQDAEPLSNPRRIMNFTSASHLIYARGSGAGSAKLDARAELLLQIPAKTYIPHGVKIQKPFRIRNAYVLEGQQVALEVDDRLVIVDTSEQEAALVERGERVRQILKKAELIAPPVVNNFTPYNESYCFINEHSGPTIEDAEFVFCLE